jgi:tripartite-type tricarboxylate transporter receptor subunit TctC
MRQTFFAVLTASLAAMTCLASAQDKWPSKPVMIIVPFAAGGNTDVMARLFADRLSAKLGQQFVVENRAGAGGSTGLAALAKSAPDGYTIGVGTTGGLGINPVLIKDKIPYNAEKDLTYLYGMAAQPNTWAVHPSVPATTMPELIAWLKANPETPYATSGIGSTQHLCGEMLAQMAGLKMAPVAYRASNQTMQDLVAGQIKLTCDNYSSVIEQARAGNVRAIAVSSLKRHAYAPDIPAVAETLPGFDVLVNFGWVGPAGIPADIAKRITEELTAVGKIPELRTALEKFGVVQTELSGEAYAAASRKERENFGAVIEKAGIKVP